MKDFCSTKLRIAILQDEIVLWEKRCDAEPRSNLYYGYIRDMMTNRIKELSTRPTVDDTTEDGWENEGGMALPAVDDNSSREEYDFSDGVRGKYVKRYRDWKKKIPMNSLRSLEEEYNGCFDERNWYDKDNKMV